MLKFNDTYLNSNGTYLSGYKVPTFNVTCLSSYGGSVSATPNQGNKYTEVTLSRTTDSNFNFINYDVSGATLYDTNKLMIKNSDVYVKANFEPNFNTVKIGVQTWMSENLAYNDGGEGIFIRWWATNDYRYYYSYKAKNRIAKHFPGWRLPESKDINYLKSYVGENNARAAASTNGWTYHNGTNTFGFNSKPLGYCYYDNSRSHSGYYEQGIASVYWINDIGNFGIYDSSSMNRLIWNGRAEDPRYTLAYQIRLIKDEDIY